MAITYEPLATNTISTSTASFSFNSISGNYTDLVLVASNVTSVSAGSWMGLRFNSDTGFNYNFTEMFGNGSTVNTYRATGNTLLPINFYNGTGVNQTGFISVTHIMNYSNSTTNKTTLTRENNAGDPNYPGAGAICGLWKSTSAITSITVVASVSNFNSGTFTLYGIKAA